MKPHQERVVTEKKELDEKIQKLTEFLDTETFETLPFEEKALLCNQLPVMEDYSTSWLSVSNFSKIDHYRNLRENA